MGGNFRKFKTRILLIRLIKSISFALSLGLVVAGTLLTLARFEIVGLEPLYSCLIGAGAALLVGVGLFFIFRASEKTIARTLDKDYNLNEKVQTMVAYKDEQGAMYDLQRADANASLAAVKDKGYVFRRILAGLICLIVCAGLFGVSFVFKPAPVEPPPPPPPPEEIPFELSENEIKIIEELIAYVNASEMSSPHKENIASALSEMLDALKEAENMTQRDSILNTSITYILDQTDESSVACELINKLWSFNSQSTKQTAKLLNYYDWPKTDEFDELVKQIDEFEKSFEYEPGPDEEISDEELLTNFKNLLTLTAQNIRTSLTDIGASENDELYIALIRLVSAKEENENGTRVYGLEAIAEKAQELGLKNAKKELGTVLDAVMGDIYKALSHHKANTSTGEYVITRVATLFKYPLPKFERPQLFDATVDNGSGGNDGGGAMGGIGAGTVYGSDDLVYDPLTNQFVEYGKIIERYNALMQGKLENESYTEEEKKAIQRYFQILYGGFETEE